jgi:phosphohistidine phosphatase
MQLLILRHGEAEARGSRGDDASRRLSEAGRKKLRRGAKGLLELVPELDALVSSPLLRALETAELVADAYGGVAIEESACLEPEREPKELSDFLASRPSSGTLAIVGHEPHLSHAASWFLGGLRHSFIELEKGGACLLEFPDEIGAGRARLVFLLTARQLRRMR